MTPSDSSLKALTGEPSDDMAEIAAETNGNVASNLADNADTLVGTVPGNVASGSLNAETHDPGLRSANPQEGASALTDAAPLVEGRIPSYEPHQEALGQARSLEPPSRSTTTEPKQRRDSAGSSGSPRSPLARPALWLGLAFVGGASWLAWAGWRSLQVFEQSLPNPQEVFTFSRSGTITIQAADGTILQQRGAATRDRTPLAQMPKDLVQGFVASEDRRFYDHQGIDVQGIGRAVWSNVVAGELVEGASTITQQLARIVFLNQERSAARKLQEAVVALRIEQSLTKDQILESYLNSVYLGSGAYGVADAAWVYFGKTLDQLSLAEMATLIALAPAPSRFSPILDPKAAEQRRNLVLDRMDVAGVAAPEAIRLAEAAPLRVNPKPPKRLEVAAPYFTSYILQELPKVVPPAIVAQGGLVVETTLNPKWQTWATEAVRKAVYERGGVGQAALVSIDPRTGEIRAMAGGTDFEKNQYNRVTQAQRQPGSTFKGFVYAAAIQAGLSPEATYMDAPVKIGGYQPKNYKGTYSGWQSVTMALTKSINSIAVKVLADTGIEPTIELVRKMGIRSYIEPSYAMALGSYEVNLLELTSAYGSFADKGRHVEAHGIQRVIDRRGQVVYEAQPTAVQALSEKDAAIMTSMLQGVVNDGTGAPAQLERPVAGKTGTSDHERDLWFIGFVPQLVTGVWLGNDNNQPTEASSAMAAATWRDFMKLATKEFEAASFAPMPSLAGRKFKPQRPKNLVEDKTFDQSEGTTMSDSERSQRNQGTDKTGQDGTTPDGTKTGSGTSSSDRPSTSRRRTTTTTGDSPRSGSSGSSGLSGSSAPARSRRSSEGSGTSGSTGSSRNSGDSPPSRRRSSGSSGDGSGSGDRSRSPRSTRSGGDGSSSGSSGRSRSSGPSAPPPPAAPPAPAAPPSTGGSN